MGKIKWTYEKAEKYEKVSHFMRKYSGASKYKNRTLFCGGCWAAYNYSLKNEWLDEFFPIKKHPTK